MPFLDPVQLSPAFKDYLWGGTRLKEEYNKQSDLAVLAESWELSAHKDGQCSVLREGKSPVPFTEYLSEIGKAALGRRCEKYDYFPLLIKFIDAKKDLSVQVHPTDEYALEHEGEYGKTEVWYVLDCDPGACLFYGFRRDVTKEEYAAAICENRLAEILNRVPVEKGDVFFIPAGTVHAIGAGIRICEIQQNSNTTYRVYDYGRRDAQGNLRPLHVEKALEVSDLKKSPTVQKPQDKEVTNLCVCQYFEVDRLRIHGTTDLKIDETSFVSLTVTEGCGTLVTPTKALSFRKGDSLFIPAQNQCFSLQGECEIIRSKVR